MTDLRPILERDFLPFIEKPLRYVGAELNIIRKQLSEVRLHGILCFPDLYDIGMSHLGLQILYHIVNKEPGWALSRCFHPWTDAEARMRKIGIPLYSLEYYTPIREADWIGFSMQYELHATNMLNMLDLAGLPLRSRDRPEDSPIVIAGGPCMTNPEPMAEFIDAFAIGDGEDTVVSICKTIDNTKQQKRPREEILDALAAIEGVYVPSRATIEKRGLFFIPQYAGANPVKAAKVEELRNGCYPSKPLVPIIEVVHHRLAVEVMRGCTRGCRFCSAGMYYRPVRERDPESLRAEIENGIGATGWRDISLLSLSTADCSQLSTLLRAAASLRERCRVAFSLPSTRIDALTAHQFDLLTSVSHINSLTIAPEAASSRLRRIINKDFTDEAIYSAAQTLLDRNVQTIKLYFMIGLPTEQPEDIEAIITMAATIAGMARAKSHRRTINVSLSPFSPKPQTPFQWEAMDSLSSLDSKNMAVKRGLARFKNVKVSYRNAHITYMETALARGDRRAGDLIEAAWKRGSRFDGWDDRFNFDRWMLAAKDVAIDCSAYTNEIPADQELPWAGIDAGVSQEFLAAERENSRKELVTVDCRSGACSACGACDTPQPRRVAVDEPDAAGLAASVPATLSAAPTHATTPPGKTYRYRFIYRKGAALKFLGHHDMADVFIRAVTAAGYPLQYSQGFQPHARISFGPPLSFGVMGETEAFDMLTNEPLTGDCLRLNAYLPHDLMALSCITIDEQAPSLSASIVAARYSIEPLEKGPDPVTMAAAVYKARSAAALTVTITKNGITKTKDLLPLIRELDYNDADSGKPCITALLSLAPAATCKPSELLAALFPDAKTMDFAVTRKECLVEPNGSLAGLAGRC